MQIEEEGFRAALHAHLKTTQEINEIIEKTRRFEKDTVLMMADLRDIMARLDKWKRDAPLFIIQQDNVKRALDKMRKLLIDAIETGGEK